MTYIDQIRMQLSFLDHNDEALYGPVAVYLGGIMGDMGYVIWREWVVRGGEKAITNLESAMDKLAQEIIDQPLSPEELLWSQGEWIV